MQQFAEMFKALSNPHRLHIFLRLISCCPPGTRCTWDSEAKRYVGQLAEEVNIAASTVSHHIKELRNAGLIRVARRGKNIECWVDTAPVEALSDLLAGRLPSGLLQDEPSREKDDWTRNAASRERTGTPSCGQNCDSVDPAASASSLPVISRLIRPAVDNRESPEREGQVQ
jgi:ArsR family transcriptional regulator